MGSINGKQILTICAFTDSLLGIHYLSVGNFELKQDLYFIFMCVLAGRGGQNNPPSVLLRSEQYLPRELLLSESGLHLWQGKVANLLTSLESLFLV